MGEWKHTHLNSDEHHSKVAEHDVSAQVEHNTDSDQPSITITKNGPYIVRGKVRIVEDVIVPSEDGTHLQYNRVREFQTEPGKPVALCRCGGSGHKPFCDGTHAKIDFDGTEIASREPYDQRAELYKGPVVSMGDDKRCAYARMCHQNGSEAWTLTEHGTDEKDVSAAIAGAWNCPAGRLVSFNDADGNPLEQQFEPTIILLQDPQEGVSAPIFVIGHVKLIGADGSEYEDRNRYTLCRCGNTQNSPFCDAMHVNIEFRDNSPVWNGETGELDPNFEYHPQI